jgi:hypothetical protein
MNNSLRDILHFGFVLVIVLLLTISKAGKADDQLSDCKEVLGLCNNTVSGLYKQTQEQGKQITEQQRYIKELEKAVQPPSLLPSWAYVAIGVLAGGVIAHELK